MSTFTNLAQRETFVETRLLVTSGRTASKEIALTQFPLIVGRHRDCQLRVTSRLVSRRHCLFSESDGWLLVEDLGSSNGTLVNGARIRDKTVLKPGDSLEIGPIAFEIHYQPPKRNGHSPAGFPVDADDCASDDTSLIGQTLVSPRDETPTILTDTPSVPDRVSDLADTHFLKTPVEIERLDPKADEESVFRAFDRKSTDDTADLDDLSWLDREE